MVLASNVIAGSRAVISARLRMLMAKVKYRDIKREVRNGGMSLIGSRKRAVVSVSSICASGGVLYSGH